MGTTDKRRELARRTIDELTNAYFLRCLNALPPKRARVLDTELTPLLHQIFKRRGAWHEIISSELSLSKDTPEKVRTLFAAQPKGTDAEDFVKKYAALVLSAKRL